MHNPTAFVSYSWDDHAHKSWVRELAGRLRSHGIDVKLDQWETAPGDQLPSFMEKAIRTTDYVLIVCTPDYKRRSDNRAGGVGYEGDVMTAEVLASQNHDKFIPLLRSGDWSAAAPSWLLGKFYLDFRADPYDEHVFDDLVTTIYRSRPKAPSLGTVPKRYLQPSADMLSAGQPAMDLNDEIRIEGIIVDEVTKPRMDGTKGSALYRIPFQLSRSPSREWSDLFLETWDHPPKFTSMHRPRIATVQGDRIILDGTTIEEVELYHRDTLKLVITEVNNKIALLNARRIEEDSRRREEAEIHKKNIQDKANRLKFD